MMSKFSGGFGGSDPTCSGPSQALLSDSAWLRATTVPVTLFLISVILTNHLLFPHSFSKHSLMGLLRFVLRFVLRFIVSFQAHLTSLRFSPVTLVGVLDTPDSLPHI